MSSTECEDIEDSKKKDMTINEKPIWCEELVDDNEMRHQCFRKKCFREVYDYNARAIIKTRLPFIFPITNYYAIRVRGNGTQAYEAIVKSYYRWLTFSKLAMNLYGYLDHFASGDYVCADACNKYIAIATASAIFIYINFRRKIISFFIDNPSDGSSDKLYVIREVKFGYYTDEDDSNHLYLVATLESGDLQAWIIETDDTTNSIETKQTKISEAKHKNLCSGTARNFYSSNRLVINKHIIENNKMKFKGSLDLSKNKEDSKKNSEGMTTFSDEIVALDSNDMNIYAVTCRVDKNADSTIEKLFLERFVCEDFLLICTEGGIAYDRKYCYEPLPEEFDSTTKIYLTMEDFIICTCGK
ncbi:GSCOCG00006906001-RA-CDS [Cotesia congregata]|nr:GSCOCG00006906001-RA-CDS [Cotesia congregata]